MLNRIIAIAMGLAMALALMVVGTSPAHAVDTNEQTPWVHAYSDYYAGSGGKTQLSAAVRYIKRVNSNGSVQFKVTAIGGRYDLGQDYMDCSDNLGPDFLGVTVNFDDLGNDMLTINPTPMFMDCWPSGYPGPQWRSVDSGWVSRSVATWAFRADLTINISAGVNDPNYSVLGSR